MIKNNMTRGVSAGVLAALSLSACGHLPIAKPAFDAMKQERAGVPADWIVSPMTGDTAAILADYSAFNDAQLIAFVQESLENNRSLRQSMETLKQSKYALQQSRSRLWPSLGASLRAGQSTLVDPFDLNDTSYAFAVSGNYNVDIMGDIGASVQGASAGYRSSQATYELARRQIAAQAARAYYAVIEGQMQLDLDRRSLERRRQTSRITQTRYDSGAIARDELVTDQARLAQSEDAIIASEQALRQSVRALEIILGRFPQNKLTITGMLPSPPPAPPLGLPELTIRSRPEVVAAELQMIQTFASNRIAHMEPWPQLDANLALGLTNTTLNNTDGLFDFDNLAFSLGATLAQTIFDGGAIDARVKSSDSQVRSALINYGARIINAYGEIVNALDAFQTAESRERALQVASDAANESLRLGELKYAEGSQSLLDLFNVRESAEQAESNLIANRRNRIEQWISLHTALGGNPTQAVPIATRASVADGGKHD